jgi:hypothetical protein
MTCLAQLASLLSVAADIATAILAFIAIVISIRALSHQQRHDRLTLRPQLTFRFEGQTGKFDRVTYKWIVENNGLGPAVIREFAVTEHGHTTKFPATNYSRGLFARNFTGLVHEEIFKKEEFIPPGRSTVLLSVNLQAGSRIPDFLGTIQWSFKYASIFDEEWPFTTDRVQLPLTVE